MMTAEFHGVEISKINWMCGFFVRSFVHFTEFLFAIFPPLLLSVSFGWLHCFGVPRESLSSHDSIACNEHFVLLLGLLLLFSLLHRLYRFLRYPWIHVIMMWSWGFISSIQFSSYLMIAFQGCLRSLFIAFVAAWLSAYIHVRIVRFGL